MKITNIKRPWQKTTQRRYNPDKRYQSQSWKKAREIHKSKNTTVTNEQFTIICQLNPLLTYTKGTISNHFCIDCYLEGKLKPMKVVDHKVRVKDGADFYNDENYQSLCEVHHNKKSANEGNQLRKKQ